MLEWTTKPQSETVTLHIGTMHGEVYALIAENNGGQAFTQFKGLSGTDLYSDGARVSPNIKTAKQICEAFMSAWRHKAN